MSIDRRIVEMRFDNQQFERGITQSNKSLETLKNNLNLEGASRGLNELDRAARSFSLAGIANGVDAIASKFNALTVIGITALTNITNSAINCGMRIASALTIDPISAGFQEYELKMNSVQTILANTQSRQKEVDKAALQSINDNADAALAAVKKSGSGSVASTKNVYDEKIKIYQKTSKEELKVLNDKFDDELEVIQKLTKEETKAFKKSHEDKLKMYDAEYMSKLKVLDEDRYNEIKGIEDQIDAINAKTKAEEKALQEKREKERLKELEKRIDEAKTAEARKEARKALAEYEDQLDRNALLAGRQNEIDILNAKKETINKEYDAKEEKLKTEYDLKVSNEKELYDIESENLKDQQDLRLKNQKKAHENEKENIQERHDLEMESLRQLQEAARPKGGGGSNKAAQMEAIEAERQAQIKALMELERGMTEGSTLDDVNKALEELNTYADKTIYNFAEMTRNIGTFTAAGVDLDTSVSAIKGIANLAAVSGSNAQQASTAMYQLSQALAAGSVKLMDWNSVVNAGMGGQVFQDSLKETARVHGIAIDEIIASEGSFRDSLQTGWLSSDILTETLSKFTGDLTAEELKMMGYTEKQIEGIITMGQMASDAATKVKTFTQLFDTLKEAAQSGWSKTFEIIIGDFEESKELLTQISNVVGGYIDGMSDARNTALEFWKDNGGREIVLEGLTNAFNGLLSVLSPIGKAFREVFPPISGTNLMEWSNGFKDLTEKFKLSETASTNLKDTFKGLFSILDLGGQAIGAVVKIFADLIGVAMPAGEGILGVTGSIGRFISEVNEAVKASGAFTKIADTIGGLFKGIADIVTNTIGFIRNVFSGIWSTDVSGAEAFASNVEGALSPLESLSSGVTKTLEGLGDGVKNIIKFFSPLADTVGGALSTISNSISNFMKNRDVEDLLALLNGGLLAGVLLGIKKFVGSLSDVTGGIGDVFEGVGGVLKETKDTLSEYQNGLKADNLIKIATAIGILAASIIFLSTIEPEKLTSALIAMGVLFGELVVAMKLLEGVMGGTGFGAVGKISVTMVSLATAILILSGALKNIADLDYEQLTTGLLGVGALMAMLVTTSKAMDKTSGIMIRSSIGLVIFAQAIKVLTDAVGILGQLDIGTLTKGLVGAGVLMAELALFMQATDLNKMGMIKATGVLILSSAMLVLSKAVGDLGAIDTAAVTQGLVAMGVIFTELGIFMQLTGGATKVVSTAIGMNILGAAMLIFSKAIESLGSMPIEQIGKGLLAMGSSLVILAGALNLLPKGMVAKGAGLIAIATALNILSSAMDSMGDTTWDELAKGLVSLGGALTIIAASMKMMTTALPGASALLVICGALSILDGVLKNLGSMSIVEICKSLAALAGTLGILGGASVLLAPLTPAMLGLAGAIALFGIGCVGAGAGIAAFSAGLAALSVSGVAGAAALTAVITSLVGLIPFVATELAEGVVEFAKIIGDGAVVICEAIGAVVVAMLDALIKCTPKLMEAIGVLLDALLKVIIDYLPKIIDGGIKLIMALLKGIADNIEDVVKTAVDVVVNFIKGVSSKISDVIQAGVDLILAFIDGLTNAINNNTDRVIVSMQNLFNALIQAALKVIFGSINTFIDSGKQLITGIINGVSSCVSNFTKAVGDVIQAGVKSVTNFVGDFVNVGKDIINGIVRGIKDTMSKVTSAVSNVAKNALDTIKDMLGIHSPSREFEKVGRWADEGLVNGIKGYANRVTKASSDLGQGALDTLKNSLSNMSDVISGDIDPNPTIRPVLDLSDVAAGSKTLGQLLNDKSVNAAATISTRMSGKVDEASVLAEIIKLLKPDDPNNPNPKAGALTATFNIYSQDGNPMKISRQIQKDLTHMNRAFGTV